MQETITIWVKACQKNDRQAQGKIYKKFSPKMYAVCLRYTKNEDDAKDCLQEAFILAFDKIGQFKFKGSFEGWLRRLTVNLCLEKLRKRTFFVVADERIEQEEEPEFELETEAENINFKALQKLIDKMPSAYQTVFTLYLLEDYTHKEIAEKLGISEGTSKSNLSRAKAWLRKELKKNKNYKFQYKL